MDKNTTTAIQTIGYTLYWTIAQKTVDEIAKKVEETANLIERLNDGTLITINTR